MRKSFPPAGLPEPGEGKRGEEGHLGYLLRQASLAFRGRLDAALAEPGVTVPQFAVLTMLQAYPGLSNADLARLSLLTPQTVSLIVGNLKRAGMLTSRRHAVHGRIRHLDITAAGRDALARCRPRVEAVEAALVAELSAAEEGIVRRWLVRAALAEAPAPATRPAVRPGPETSG